MKTISLFSGKQNSFLRTSFALGRILKCVELGEGLLYYNVYMILPLKLDSHFNVPLWHSTVKNRKTSTNQDLATLKKTCQG